VRQLRDASRARGVQLILSFHDFKGTPAQDVLERRFAQAQQSGADVAKVAAMPRDMQDVLALLGATLAASRQLTIPVVSMSMAGLGSLTRLCGGAFGSAMSFAVGQGRSAPGQLAIEDLERGLAILRRASTPAA
jgi:3-dehydroquinate dehydratase-1